MTNISWALPTDARCRRALLTAEDARALDRAAISAGIPEIDLMERAGAAVALEIRRRWPVTDVVMVAGPGNNGGDGFVAARLLRDAGWPVRLALLGDKTSLRGAAAIAASRWDGETVAAQPEVLNSAGLVVDALFGTGLTRPLEGGARAMVAAINARKATVIAVDLPSGIDADSGAVLGSAVQADLTVTFFRRKVGLALLPGRELAGEIVVAELDVPEAVFGSIATDLFLNGPELWAGRFPWPTPQGHKYTRGHAVILGGSAMTGAAKLAAHAAQRIGAGLVTIASDPSVAPIYTAFRPDLLIAPLDATDDFRGLLADLRRNAVLLGPGAGADARLAQAIAAALDAQVGLVLDADCFAILADRGNGLAARLGGGNVLLTPHEGEFARLFGSPAPRLEAARRAARESGATVLLKGADTIIAHPAGQAIINDNAPPDLATAGSGDALAGLAVGLMANRLLPFLAGAIAAWVHGAAAASFGPGLTASDIPDLVPRILTKLKKNDSEAQ